MTAATQAARAASLAARGFPVFAVIDGGKKPSERNWQANATLSGEDVSSCFARLGKSNIGVKTGDDLFVVDVDVRNGKGGEASLLALQEKHGELPTTFMVRTPSGGRHLYFKTSTPVKSSVSKLAPGIDIRGEGGFVVGAGSSLHGEGEYRIEVDTGVAIAPDWLIAAAGRATPRKAATNSESIAPVDTDSARLRAAEYLRKAPPSKQGEGGDDNAFKIAAKVKDLGVSEDVALDLMAEHWNPRCCPVWELDDLLMKVNNAYRYGASEPGVSDPRTVFDVVPTDPSPEPQRLRRELIVKPGTKTPARITANVQMVLEMEGVTVLYDVIAKRVSINVPNFASSIDNRDRVTLQRVADLCAQYGVPTADLDQMVLAIADHNQRNPVIDVITSTPWDQKDRIAALVRSIEGPALADVDYGGGRKVNLKMVLVERWLASAVGAAFEPAGIAAQGVLVFAGAQHLRKTTWFRKLVPAALAEYFGEGKSLDPSDKDLVHEVVSCWIVELGELDSTFSKSELGALKAFITKSRDTLRLPYARAANTYPRRTIFGATVNQPDFLRDATGNRRYWTIPVTRLNVDHGIDLQQLWAQVREQLYRPGDYTSWCLTDEELAVLNASNDEFTEDDPVADALAFGYDWTKPPSERTVATDIVKTLGLQGERNASKRIRRVAEGLGAQTLRTGKGRWLLMPPRIFHPASPPPFEHPK